MEERNRKEKEGVKEGREIRYQKHLYIAIQMFHEVAVNSLLY